MQTWHLTFASDGRHALFPDEALRRRAVRALARTAGDEMVVFGIVDDHLHVVVLCDRDRAGRIARSLLLALRATTSVPIDPSRLRAVEGRSHLDWLVRYVLTQTVHHGVPVDPALWTGSCFPDLVGARRVAGLRLTIREALPRFRLRDAYRQVGLPELALRPAGNDDVRHAGAGRLVEAAAAAVCAGPGLAGKDAERVLARRAAVQVGRDAGIAFSELAWAIGQPPRSIRRLAKDPVDAGSTRAVRLWLALQDAVRARRATRPTDT